MHMGLWSRFKRTFRGGSHSDEIQEELQFHLDMDAAAGHSAREARLRLGNLGQIEEATRAMGILEWMDTVLVDVRYGLRQLRKTPGLTFAVVLSLTIGIGANTAIFSLVDAAILRTLPVKDPDKLVIVEWTHSGFPEGATNINGDFNKIEGGRVQASSVSQRHYRQLAKEQTAYEALMGMGDPSQATVVTDGSATHQVSLQYVSHNFFQGLGVMPVLGRPFREEEDRAGAEQVVVVSHRFWMTYLGGSKEALERRIRINQTPARIIGVAPAGFFGLRAGQWNDVYVPMAMRESDDGNWWVRQVGRLKDERDEAAARAELASLFKKMAAPELITKPGRRGFNALNARDQRALWILVLLVAVLLLIVCVNVANLLLSRAVSRNRESAVRLALGAARTRLLRQHLIESGMFAILGGGGGLLLGYLFAESIHLLFQTGRDASNAFDLHLDPRVLLYTGALSIFTALLFGVAPAIQAARANLGDALRAQTRTVIGGRPLLPSVLVSIQMALCLTALVAAGLLGRSLGKLKMMDIGFDRENLAYASAGFTDSRTSSYVERVREELSRLPGVAMVSVTQVRLLSGNGNGLRVNIPGRERPVEPGIVDPMDVVHQNRVGAGFFETLRIPLLAGRVIEPRDIRSNASAVVVDELFAKRFFPNQDPLGRRFGLTLKQNDTYEIVGVVGDTRYRSLRGDLVPTVYQPFVPGELRGPVHFAIRARVDSGVLGESVRKVMAAVDPSVPLTEFHTQTTLIDRLLRTERLLSFLSGAFGVIALALAAIGLGGLLAYAVARRTGEIGVRMAIGATSRDVVTMVLRDSLRVVGWGLLVGLPCAYGVGRVLKTALFGLEPWDAWTGVLSLGALMVVALLAAWAPAWRAARINPIRALREE
jgi:predicted permease